MDGFWTGVGTAAAVVGAITAVVIGIIGYRRGRSSHVVVTASQHRFEYPPLVAQLVKLVDEYASYGGFAEEAPASPRPFSSQRTRVAALLSDPTLLSFIRRFPPEALWTIRITNRGHERAESVELQVPNGKASVVKNSDGTRSPHSGAVVRIPELRPGETVSILAWADAWSADLKPALLQAKGRAVVKME